MSAKCSYCYRTAWWMCRECGAIMCDKCDPLHKCQVLKIAGEVVYEKDLTPLETQMSDELVETK